MGSGRRLHRIQGGSEEAWFGGQAGTQGPALPQPTWVATGR